MGHFHTENQQSGTDEGVHSAKPSVTLETGRVVRELNKRPDVKLNGADSSSEPEQLGGMGTSTLPKFKGHAIENSNRFVSTTPNAHERIDQTFGTPIFVGSSGTVGPLGIGRYHEKFRVEVDSTLPASERGLSKLNEQRRDATDNSNTAPERPSGKRPQSTEPSAGDKSKREEEAEARGSKKHEKAKGAKSHFNDSDEKRLGAKSGANDRSGDESDRDDRIVDHLKRDRFREPRHGPFVEGSGARAPLQDPDLNGMGRAIMSAEKSSDNFHLMKEIRGLSDIDLRLELEKGQSAINRDLGHPSVRLGVDENHIHAYYKGTDVTLPYNPTVDAKLHLDVNDPTVRRELTDRLQSSVKDLWGADLGKMSTSELALFDAISRSDGPALRSAMNGIKSADELDKQFQHIADFCNSQGVTNWGNIVWSNDLKSLTVHNIVPLYVGEFPLLDQGDNQPDSQRRISELKK